MKRAGEDSGPKKKPRPGEYTQGPLDEVFGQHRALPLETDCTDAAHQYLILVRQEAEADRAYYTARENMDQAAPEEIVRSEDLQGPAPTDSDAKQLDRPCVVDPETRKRIMDKLLAAKQAQEEPQGLERDELGSEVTISVVDLVGSDGAENESDGTEEETAEAEEETAESEENPTHSNGETPEQAISDKTSERSNPLTTPETVSTFVLPQLALKWRELVFGLPPPDQAVFAQCLEHTTVIKLIFYYTRWLLPKLPPSLGEWMFRTFVRLHSGVDHREQGIIRELGVKAKKVKAQAPDAPQHLLEMLDMVLVVVGDYYSQKDLLQSV